MQTGSTANTNRYSAEIDGLRAIAVLSVLLYHFDFTIFSGGFVGVDIFFVISGYLITRLILDEIQVSSSFRFKRFYLRRIRRLFPALFATLIATFGAATVLFSPEDLAKLSGSLVYALLSASNVFFWMQAGYFDSAAAMKPLLHTWSLSVEEQFYLIWPALLVLSSRVSKHFILSLIVLAGLVSLTASELTLTHSASAAFYWMPLRIFEFATGALLYWTQKYRKPDNAGSELLALCGIGLIAYCIFSFDEASSFPGALALLPCVGTACLIQAGPTRILGRILCSRPLVAVGLISYSLYLVHWPLVVFLKYSYGSELSLSQKGLLLAASFTCATLLYKLIERPLRHANNSNEHTNTDFALCCTLLTLTLALPAADAWANKGWSWRFSEARNFLTRYDINNKDYVWALWRKFEAQPNPQSRAYIIGDSQAADILNSIQLSGALSHYDLPPRLYHVQFSCGAVTVPATEKDHFYEQENELFLKTKSRRDVCEKQRDSAFAASALKDSDLIILSPFWRPYLVKRLPQTLEHIRNISRARIIVVGHKHMLASSTAIFNKHQSLVGIERFAAKFIDPETLQINSSLATIAAKQHVLFFDPLTALCDDNRSCQVVGEQGGPITFDTHHLTPEGAALMGAHFKAWLTQNDLSAGL